MKVFASWSGGKESCLACFNAIASGLKVSHLLNMVTMDAKKSMTHGISSELLALQSRAIGIPIIQQRTTWSDYERDFRKAIMGLKKEGVEGGVFGDIDIQEHRDWVERICAESNIKPILPLWWRSRRKLLSDFITAGFEAVVVAAKADIFEREWVDHRVDEELVEHLEKLLGVDICGEYGEYHTFVVNGPIFKNSIKILACSKVLRDGYWFLNISKYKLDTRKTSEKSYCESV